MDYLRRYQELKPSDADGYNYLAMGYLRNGEFSKAQEHLEKLIELRPEDGVAYLNLAKVHLRYRDRAAAKKALDKGMSQKGVSIEQYGQLKAMRDQLGD
jgi:Flp pilus assembly protein TadD